MIKAKNTPTHNAAQIQKMFLNQIKAKDFFSLKKKLTIEDVFLSTEQYPTTLGTSF